jgi:hypothetical protein
VDLVSSDGSSDLNMDTDLPRDVDEAVMQVFIRFFPRCNPTNAQNSPLIADI